MSETAYISTHRLPLAGELRKAFRDEGFQVELTPSPEHLAEGVLLVLTGDREFDAWDRRAGELDLPIFLVGGEADVEESFGREASAGDVALVARRTVQRRKLQDQIGIVGESEAMREVLERVVQFAPVDSTVLVTGESGTGKELVARGIHLLSPRRHQAFLGVNVAALSETLLESELFGHEKGAFTGAIDSRRGFFELANRGTLFLDEIGEMPLATQTKLLRVLEQREFLRVGGESPIRVDVRIVAATNRDLREMVQMGEFRRDLYYRLNILSLHLPPLRRRVEDIPALVRYFVREVSNRLDRPFPGISEAAMDLLRRHAWPGNVRELQNLVESMVVLSPGREIGPADIPDEIRQSKALTRIPQRSPERSRTDLKPELEFVFRTLMEMRVDLEDLRRDFEAYREEMEDPAAALPPGGIEVGRVEPEEEEDPSQVLFRPGMTMEEMEARAIEAVLDEMEGNRRKAAESLGIGERTLYRKLRRYGIDQ